MLQAKRHATTQQARTERMVQRELDHGFNPITGKEYSHTTGSWQEASNPWQHYRPGIRPAHKIAEGVASTGALRSA
jgi:hypothetical protein